MYQDEVKVNIWGGGEDEITNKCKTLTIRVKKTNPYVPSQFFHYFIYNHILKHFDDVKV